MSFTCLDVAQAARLDEGRRAGAERYFRCPQHDDGKPSLAVHDRKDVWMCGPCGAQGTPWQLAAFVAGHDPGDKLAVAAWLQDHGLLNGRREITATYDYTDEDGELLFQVVRFEPKDFRQRRPDGHGDWHWNLKGVRRVLYRLPELLAATDVFIVEGEKDVEALRALGFAATTCPGGAGKWRPEYAEHFSDEHHVAILPDLDDAGRRHARHVAASLHGRVASVKVLALPVRDKGDASDFVAGFDDTEEAAERLAVMAEGAPEWEPGEGASEEPAVTLEDFYAYMPQHRYLYIPCREMWPASSVNSRLPRVPVEWADKPVAAAKWLDRERPVEQMTWAPGESLLIEDRLIAEGGWIERPGVRAFNLYRAPQIEPGDPGEAGPWLDHVVGVYPDDAEHIIAWLAHRVQRPHEKINHALVLGGLQGIGKDTLIEPVKRAVGPWNVSEVSPVQMMGRFNGFVKSVILRVSEARDLGDVNRFTFYDHLKVYTAAPPDVLRIDEKHIREYAVPNVCGVVITTNHKSDGIYLPADDRRHYVAWSTLTKDDFPGGYWAGLWGWYEDGGTENVTAYLAEYDLSAFDPKAPPPQTAAFRDIVDANRAPEDAELADALDVLGWPDATTLGNVAAAATKDFEDWLTDRRNSRQVPHRMEAVGYVPCRNDAAKDGRWKVSGRRVVIYAKQELSLRDRLAAARDLIEAER